MKRGDRAQVQTEMVEFMGLPFSSSKKLKIWSFHVVVVQERQRNVQKRVMHVQSCFFASPRPPSPVCTPDGPTKTAMLRANALFLPRFSPFATYLVGYMFIPVGKVFGKAFRLDPRIRRKERVSG